MDKGLEDIYLNAFNDYIMPHLYSEKTLSGLYKGPMKDISDDDLFKLAVDAAYKVAENQKSNVGNDIASILEDLMYYGFNSDLAARLRKYIENEEPEYRGYPYDNDLPSDDAMYFGHMVFTDPSGKKFVAAEDIDDYFDLDKVENENFIDDLLKELGAQLTDRTHPSYPYGKEDKMKTEDKRTPESLRDSAIDYAKEPNEVVETPKYNEEDENTITDMLNLYLSEKHPDMNVEQWKNNLDDQEEINFNRWFDENADKLKDDNGHTEENDDKDPGVSPDVLSDESLKNIIGTLSERIL